MPYSDDKLANLLVSKEEKLNAFAESKQEKVFADNNLDRNTYTDTGDGYIENNGNKMWGIGTDFTPQELGFATDYIKQTYGLPDSSKLDRRFYQYGVTDEGKNIDPEQAYQRENYDPTKFGLSTGKATTADVRYIPEQGGWAPGPRGVDVTRKQQDNNLYNNAAVVLESLYHTNQNALNNRLIRQRSDGLYDYDSPTGLRVINKAEKDALFGSGASEYYTNANLLVDKNYDPAKVDQQKVINAINEGLKKVEQSSPYASKVAQQYNNQVLSSRDAQTLDEKYTSGIERAVNTAQAFGASFTNSLIAAPIRAIGDLTGLYSTGTEESNTKAINQFFGYNPKFEQIAMERIGKNWEDLANDQLPIADRVRAAASGMLEAFTTPEMLGSSLGALLSWVTPGTVLKGIGIGSKFASTVGKIDAAVKAGEITSAVGKAQKLNALMSINGIKAAVTSQSGFMVSALGEVNNQYNEFVKNNNGVELEGSDKAAWFAGRFAVQLINQNLDKFTDFNVMKTPGLLAAALPAVKAMTNKEFANVAKTIGKGILVTTENMGKEAAQEYSQTMMELFNSRYGSETFKDADSFTSFITDKRNTTEAGVAALAGAGGAGQFELAGAVGSGLLKGTGKAVGTAATSLASTAEASPDSSKAIEQVKQVVQENLAKSVSATPSASSYYASQGSTDVETKQKATDFAVSSRSSLLDGSNTIYNSDEDTQSKLTKISNLVEIASVEDPTLDSVTMSEAVAKHLNTTVEASPEIAQVVEKAVKAGQQFASIKSLLDVSGEVSNGTKGFVTYFTKAKIALAEGDTAAYDESIGNLERFYQYEKTKVSNINTAIDKVRQTIASQVDVEAKRRGISQKAALENVITKLKTKDTKDANRYSDQAGSGTFEVSHLNVALDLANKNNPKYKAKEPIGVFKLLDQVTKEVNLMGSVYDQLAGNESNLTSTPTTEVVSTTTSAAPVEPKPITATTTPVDVVRETLQPQESVQPTITQEQQVQEQVTTETSVPTVAEFVNANKEIKALQKAIEERKAELRVQRATKEAIDSDIELTTLQEQLSALETNVADNFTNEVANTVKDTVKALGPQSDIEFTFYTNYSSNTDGDPRKITLNKLFSNFKVTGFTLAKIFSKSLSASTRTFGSNLHAALNLGDKGNILSFNNIAKNPILPLLYNKNNSLNNNTVVAMQAAAYEFLSQDALNLAGGFRTDEDIAEMFNIEEDEVTPDLRDVLRTGGVTLKVAADTIGEKVAQNLGISLKEEQAYKALVTKLGTVALQGIYGSHVTEYIFTPSSDSAIRQSVRLIKGKPDLFDNIKSVRSELTKLEDTYGVELDKERTYSLQPSTKNRVVKIRKNEYLEAPPDHTTLVNNLEKTSFAFNSGVEVLNELYSDQDSLTQRVLGNESDATNLDSLQSFKARKEAFTRSLGFFQKAVEDVKDSSIFFNWFIAKNHRIHLDSNTINPQTDKNLARWLLTTTNSRKELSISDIDAVLDGKPEASMQAKMFAYAIVQAFDGAKGIPSVDKTEEKVVLAAAAKLLRNTSEGELIDMIKGTNGQDAISHVGHGALALANIRKFINAKDTFTSDMVFEVDGLTNGFAFRALQFPMRTGTDQNLIGWAEKVGVVSDKSELYTVNSMNAAKSKGVDDVYISVGKTFLDNVVTAIRELKPSSTSSKWITLLQGQEELLPNFLDSTSDDSKKFVRTLMKSPVMVFNYGAGALKIVQSLVNDQIYGEGYIKNGLIDALTAKIDKDNYKISKELLIKTFGKEQGSRYHLARVALKEDNLSSRKNSDISFLRKDLTKAINDLYGSPVKNTLNSLFEEQTTVNLRLIQAATFMFNHFKQQFDLWKLNNPEATSADIDIFLSTMAELLPGIKGASSDSQQTKVAFLRKALEQTDNYSAVVINNNKIGTGTITRTYAEPGAVAAVLTILSLDSSVMAKTLNEAYKSSQDGNALPIHDAIVLGVDEHQTINTYNNEFYTTNKGYSVLDEFVKAIENFEKQMSNGDAAWAQNTTILDAKKEKTITFAEMKDALIALNTSVQANRKELFSQNMKIGQMNGPEGTMAVINIQKLSADALRTLERVKAAVLAEVGKSAIVNALGKKADFYINEVKALLDAGKVEEAISYVQNMHKLLDAVVPKKDKLLIKDLGNRVKGFMAVTRKVTSFSEEATPLNIYKPFTQIDFIPTAKPESKVVSRQFGKVTAYFYPKNSEFITNKSIAFTRWDENGNPYIVMQQGITKEDVINHISGKGADLSISAQKNVVTQHLLNQYGIDLLATINNMSEKEVKEFVVKHELSHAKNSDNAKVYYQNSEQSIANRYNQQDVANKYLADSAIEIEARAHIEALLNNMSDAKVDEAWKQLNSIPPWETVAEKLSKDVPAVVTTINTAESSDIINKLNECKGK